LVCFLLIYIGKKKLKKYFFPKVTCLFVFSFCFVLLFILLSRVHKTRKYPRDEPTIEFTTPQTTVVYNHNTLNTNPPFKIFIFIFFFILHRGKDHSFHSIARRAAVGRRKIVLCIAHFTKRYILHSIFMVVTVVFVAKSRVFYPCFKRDESIR
jgi:hypothetical protein